MFFYPEFWILLAVSALACAIGFKKYVWFISIGYGMSIAAIGYLGIIYIMFSGARRLEIRQDKSYGDDPEYQEYIKKTPILLPLVPLYSVKKHKWLVG